MRVRAVATGMPARSPSDAAAAGVTVPTVASGGSSGGSMEANRGSTAAHHSWLNRRDAKL